MGTDCPKIGNFDRKTSNTANINPYPDEINRSIPTSRYPINQQPNNIIKNYQINNPNFRNEQELNQYNPLNELPKYQLQPQDINKYQQENVKEIDKYKLENETLKNQVKEINNYKFENETLKNQIKEINNYKLENENLKNQIKEINNYKLENENLKNQVKEIDKYKTENENLKNQVKEIDKYKTENETLKNQVKEINNYKTENETLKNQVKEIENYKLKNEALIKEKEEQEKNNTLILNSLENQNSQYKAKIILLEKDLKENNDQLKILKEPILVGLDNIGATCYMNATLQSLSNTPDLSKYFLDKERYKINLNNIGKIMSNEYYEVVKNLWDRNNHNKSYAPHSFKNILSQENPLFAGIQANDSKDLINFLLERFHQELNSNEMKVQQNNNTLVNQVDQLNEKKMLEFFFNDFKIKYHSIISDLFYGIMETKSQCLNCQNIKYNFQVYSFLEFPLEQVNKYCFDKGKRNNISSYNKNPDVNLYECFNYYGNVEKMQGDNQMYCNICRKNYDALYGTNLYTLPHYLIINLNRGKGAVYECKVIFPEKLNLLNFVTYQDGITYMELYAVISHIGPSSMSGHFVAYCKNHIDKKWYKYNDSIVTLCTKKNEYNEGMPYILFYKAL